MAAIPRTLAAGALCALLLAAPAPAAARVTVSVEFVYGGVLACGLGIFIAFGGSWDIDLADRLPSGALLEVGAGRSRLGLPLPALELVDDADGGLRSHERLHFDLLRWRF